MALSLAPASPGLMLESGAERECGFVWRGNAMNVDKGDQAKPA